MMAAVLYYEASEQALSKAGSLTPHAHPPS